eukprot:scaffold17835_cov129-Isochrysis_galbana.AAC.1
MERGSRAPPTPGARLEHDQTTASSPPQSPRMVARPPTSMYVHGLRNRTRTPRSSRCHKQAESPTRTRARNTQHCSNQHVPAILPLPYCTTIADNKLTNPKN